MNHSLKNQRGFAMAAMFIAVALIGGLAAIFEQDRLSAHYDETTANDQQASTTDSLQPTENK